MGGVGPAHHAEPVEQPEQAGEDRDEQRDLQGARSCVRVDAHDLVLDLGRLTGELLLEPGVAQDLRVLLEGVGDLFLGGGRQHGAVLGHLRENDRERREHDRSGEREPERQPERPGGGVDPGGLADALVGDRGEGVVVELGGTSSPSPAPAIVSGMTSAHPNLHAGRSVAAAASRRSAARSLRG